MSSTIGQLSQYQVLAALGSNPATLSVVPNRLVSCQITRGRADELGTMQVGQMTLVLDNKDGAFSPDNPASPYAGYLVPGRKMQIAARFDTATPWNPLYTGYIDSIRPEDNGPLDSNVIIQCIDWLGKMSIKAVTGTVTSGGYGPHDLINWFVSLMTLVDSTISYTIVNPTDGTSQHFLDLSLVDSNALQAINDFAATARGVVFVGADGTVRATANGGTAVTTTFNTFFVFDQQGLNLAANVVPYTAMDYDLTTQFLYNDITITAPPIAGGTQNVQDAPSITAYDKRSYNANFTFMGLDQAQAMASTLLLAYRNPHPRVHALTIDVDGTTGITQGGHTAADLLFGLEITVPLTIAKSQPGNLSINRKMVVEGIKHDIKPDFGGAGVMHEITLLLTEATEINPEWQLGVSALGVDTILGYGKPKFDPTSISGCQLWLVADKGITLSGSNVTRWADQSGNGNTATPASGVPILTNVQANQVAVLLQFFNNSYMTLPVVNMSTTWSLFVVTQSGFTTAAPLFYVRNAAATAFRGMSVGGSTGITAKDSDGTNSAIAQDILPIMSNGQLYLYSATSADGQPVIVHINDDAGMTATSSAPLTNITMTNCELGAFNGTNSADLQIAAVIVYNRVLNATERAYVLNGLNAKYLIY